MIDDFKENQKIGYNIIVNSIQKNKLSHAYLFDTNAYPKKMEFVMSFIKYLLCPNHYTNLEKCVNCTQCKKIEDGNYTEIKYIEPDGMWIKKEQLAELQKEFSTKALLGKNRVYVINQAEKLNPSAANSILKFLEEPEEGIVAILLTDNMYQLLDTIISRCQVISLKKANTKEMIASTGLEETELLQIGMQVTNTVDELKEFIENEKNKILLNQVVQFIDQYEKDTKDVLLSTKDLLEMCKDRSDFLHSFDLMILYYQDMIRMKLGRSVEIFKEKQSNMKKIIEKNNLSLLCQKLNIMINLKEEIKYNVNQNLLLDRLVLMMEEVTL